MTLIIRKWKKKMSDYEKASTSSSPDAIEEPKFNYDYEDEVEYPRRHGNP
jgi:hypothetical protein